MSRAMNRTLSRPLPGLRHQLCLCLALALGAGAALADADQAPARKAFRVCKDTSNMPFTNSKGEGFEDKLAELFARDLGVPVEYYAFPQRLGFIRNTLRYKMPGEDYPCDIVMGVPAGFEQVLTTKPYYRSTYVLLLPAGKGLDGVNSEAEFLALPREKLAGMKIGVFDRSPGSTWLEKHELLDSGVQYRLMSPNPDEHPGDLIERDLAQGSIDAAVVWGPIGGYIARQAKASGMRVVPLVSSDGIRFEYAMAMGVRFGEKEWKKQVEDLIDRNRSQIDAILRDYGVPLLPEAAKPADGSREARQVAAATPAR